MTESLSAKYPLSIVAKALDALGPRLLIGYDIGCVFGKTILSTSLSAKFLESGSRTCVNAFHGYSHNYACQCKNHPNNIAGVGLEDLETLERVFSSSNALAAVTRHASAYRRRLYIEMHFKQWDEDKYSNLATMLCNNYHQALDIIRHDRRAVDEAKLSLGVTDKDLDSWKIEEEEYFLTLGDEPDGTARAIAYVELLQKLRQLKYVCWSHLNHVPDIFPSSRLEKANTHFIVVTPDDYRTVAPTSSEPYAHDRSTTQKRETERRLAIELRENCLEQIIKMEVSMGIDRRWDQSTPEYLETLGYLSTRRYQRALEELQRLVIQRLFELHKMNISATGQSR